jgi:3-phenylpropionate/trans-cinnamate dioxygenase ferredoxin reductase subunit
MTSTVVIVGAGHAGVQLAESLREEGFAGRIIVVGEEIEQPYQRPPLTKDLLAVSAEDADLLPLRGEQVYAALDVDLRLGRRAVRVDRRVRQLVLDDDSVLGYDHLVLATGARCRSHPAAPCGGTSVYAIRNAEDALRFGRDLGTAKALAVIGAGFVGLEVAAAARSKGVEVTIVSTKPPLSRVASEPLSTFLFEAHRERGSRFVLDHVVSIGTPGRATRTALVTGSGEQIAADMILVAIGAIPNAELARAAGLTVSDGITVNAHSRTSDERVWAIGDVARRPDTAGSRSRDESVQAATHQARCLARTLTGRPTVCTEIPWFWSNQADIRIQIAGRPFATAETVIRRGRIPGRFSVFSYTGKRLVAVESVNSPADHLAARRLLKAGANVEPEQAADQSFDLKSFSLEVAHLRPCSTR